MDEKKPKRKPISKKLRFEVFKRDSFTCQYCGRKAPDVILEVDHIKPVSDGGTNTILNLVTSCQECNRGKGKTSLTEQQTVEKERKQLEVLQERREQLKMIMKWHDELLQEEADQVSYIGKIVLTDGCKLTETGERNIKKHIAKFGFYAVIQAAKIAARQYGDCEERLKKLGGIAYNKIYKDKEW